MSRLFNFEGATQYLGVEPRYLRRLVSERRIAFYKDRRRLFFAHADLDAYVEGLQRSEARAKP